MNSHSPPAGKLSLKELCILSLTGALMFASKAALASLPNVHINAVIIIITAVFFGWKSLYSVAVYVMMEGLVFGFSLWWVCYLYAWPLLAAAAVLMRKCRSPLLWAVLAAAHGALFGALCALPVLFAGGWEAGVSYWIAGIPFDISHCAANFILTLLLFKPLCAAAGAALNGMHMNAGEPASKE